MSAAFHFVAWGWYGVRLVLSLIHTVLSFLSKPGARYTVGGLLALGGAYYADQLQWLLLSRPDLYPSRDPREVVLYAGVGGVAIIAGLFILKLRDFVKGLTKYAALALLAALVVAIYRPVHEGLLPFMPSLRDRLTFHVVLAVTLAGMAIAYRTASQGLAHVLGPFPPPSLPLPPRRKLKARTRVIVPAAVRVVVPPLPRRKAGDGEASASGGAVLDTLRRRVPPAGTA
ncbi:hypothetical protein FBZ89_114135 [Nitrospirillum amazonense]|uniref:Uncharacterized protein n=1 Tax=Nitrospirillum amazonense TaxID=28077 RepID=A0A560F1Q8_9PROT|nr:hypothetical protein [Nitrospirillum amazonense]TWB15541.1 hypothetical protein FBZ89_114135 [Nitrospirillum amazonense]